MYPSNYPVHLLPKYFSWLRVLDLLLGEGLADFISITHTGLGQEEISETLEREMKEGKKEFLKALIGRGRKAN